MAWGRGACGLGVCKRLVGDVGASGQSEWAHEVGRLETLMRNFGIGISSSRAQVHEALYFPPFFFYFSTKVALNYAEINVEP